MADVKHIFYILVGLCYMSVVLSAATNMYVIPDLEAVISYSESGEETFTQAAETEASVEDDVQPKAASSAGDMEDKGTLASGEMDNLENEMESGDTIAEEKDASGDMRNDGEIEDEEIKLAGDMENDDEESLEETENTKGNDTIADEDNMKISEEISEISALEELEAIEKAEKQESGINTNIQSDEAMPADKASTSSSEECSMSGGDDMTSAVDDLLDSIDEGASTRGSSSRGRDCHVTQILRSMVEFLRLLNTQVQQLREQVALSCTGSGLNATMEEEMESTETQIKDVLEKVEDEDDSPTSDDGGDDEQTEDDDEEEVEMTTEAMEPTTPEPSLPPPPESCPAPFQLLAGSCYYIQTDPRERRSWGEAQAFCQTQGSSLAAPWRPQDLRDYLTQSYSSVFWVGARFDENSWVWLNGNDMAPDDWKTGQPSRRPAKHCVYLQAWSHYRAVSHYCGEKFSFVCEYKEA